MQQNRVYGEELPINMDHVREFYDKRAGMFTEKEWGAVLLGDQNPSIAENTNRYDRDVIFPKLRIDKNSHVLDLGCGVGRWAKIVLPYCATYCGVDFSEKLIQKARALCKEYPNADFLPMSVSEVVSKAVITGGEYNRLILSGVCMYINDNELKGVFQNLLHLCRPECLIYMKDTVATDKRLTLRDFPSEALQADYNSIYRTKEEYIQLFQPLLKNGFTIEEQNFFPKEVGRVRTETNSMYTILYREGK